MSVYLLVAYTSLLYFTAPRLPFSVPIIHLAHNSRMICWREDFDARVCGVLRKLVNVTGRNPDVIYPLRRGSPGRLIKKKSRIRIDSVERRSARSRLGISVGIISREKEEGFAIGTGLGREGRDEDRCEKTHRRVTGQPQWSINNRLQSLRQGVASAFTLVFLFFLLLFRLFFLRSSLPLHNANEVEGEDPTFVNDYVLEKVPLLLIRDIPVETGILRISLFP